MSYWRQFEEFNPLTGKIPLGPFFVLNIVASRARDLLKDKSLREITSIALSIDWIIYEQVEQEYVAMVHPEDESAAALEDFISDTENTETDISRFSLFESSIEEQDEDHFDESISFFIDEVGVLKDYFDRYYLEDMQEYKMFAVLSLWKIADCLNWTEYKPTYKENAIGLSIAEGYASKALDALCYAERLLAIQPLESELEKYSKQLNQRNEEMVKLVEVNTPPAKAGGFGLRLKAGSVGTSADGCRYTT
ncbi:MAG: hypothetical protein KDI68_06325 [Gammaproteobacteria bacterium]|nr:hypothetical protein [Gammaproteobacteria bacterium]